MGLFFLPMPYGKKEPCKKLEHRMAGDDPTASIPQKVTLQPPHLTPLWD